jgi:hypothetical protein
MAAFLADLLFRCSTACHIPDHRRVTPRGQSGHWGASGGGQQCSGTRHSPQTRDLNQLLDSGHCRCFSVAVNHDKHRDKQKVACYGRGKRSPAQDCGCKQSNRGQRTYRYVPKGPASKVKTCRSGPRSGKPRQFFGLRFRVFSPIRRQCSAEV